MALDKGKLEQGLIDALKKGEETEPVSGGEEGEVKAKYTEGDVAGFIADAIADYASDAEFTITGPVVIPTPPAFPTSSAVGSKVKNTMADVGKSALKSAIASGFAAGDAPLAMMTAGIVAYLATFTVFSGGGNTVAGGTIPVPPLLSAASITVQTSGGALEDWCKAVAAGIHTSFKASMFAGAVVAADGGAGGALPGPLQ